MSNFLLGIMTILIAIAAVKVILLMIRAVLAFVWEHIGATVFIALILIIYYFVAKNPFEFLNKWGNGLKKFLWQLTYGNSAFDTIWISVILFLLTWIVSKSIVSLFKKEIIKIVVCVSVSVIFGVASCIGSLNIMLYILAAETICSCIILLVFKSSANDKIGWVKDVSNTFAKLEILNIQVSLIGWFVEMNAMDRLNELFMTSMPLYMPGVILGLVVLIVQEYLVLHTFKGYGYINRFVQKHKFFCYEDYYNAVELRYLYDMPGYVSSVTDILTAKKKIYLMPFGNKYFINNQLKHQLEKNIKANKASKEVEKTVNTDFREFGFDMIYKTVFAWVKGYEIDFAESMETKKRKRSKSGIGATEFILMRYPIEEHPILKESVEVRADYITALNGFVSDGNIEKLKWDAKVEEYLKEFEVIALAEDVNNAMERFSKSVQRKEGKYKKVKSDYSYLLLLESIYFQNLLSIKDISYKEIEKVFDTLKIKKKYRDFIYQYIKAMFIEGNVNSAEQLLQSKLKEDVRMVLEYIHSNIMWNESYVILNQYNVAVCATMSAGKSTFINAMLGTDYIPAKNEACTAKITTIRDNDNLDKIIGCYTRIDNSKVYSNIIDGKLLSEWNEDVQIREMILEGDLEEIKCQNGVLVMHDTPGTNNSGDESHHNTTIEFLQTKKLDLIIYLINAEYISTNDTEILLKEIQDIIKDKETRIIFGLNKIDCFDEESDESINNAIEGIITQLLSYGFVNPIVFPFSANAARLFKLAIKGRELTKREKREFIKLMERFSVLDASEHIVGVSSSNVSDAYRELENDKMIKVGDVEYSYNSIIDALNHTGILNLVNWLSEEISKKEWQ